jgi:hypothetical protein
VKISRFTVSYPEDGAVLVGMPMFKLPSQLHWEGIAPSKTAAAYHQDDIPTHHDKAMYEAIPELIGAGQWEGDGTPTVAEYAASFNTTYGGVIGYIYDNLNAAVTNLLTNIGYGSNEAFAIESELLSMLSDMGILDWKFEWTEIQKMVNENGIYSMVDLIEKTKSFGDRPRPVLRHSKHPWFLTAAATPESTPFYPGLHDYIDDATNGDVIEDHDYYEYLRTDITAAGWPAIASSGNWDAAAVYVSDIDDAGAGIPQDEGSLAGYGIALDRQLKEMWSPYRDWFLPSEDYLEEDGPTETGRIFAVRDEYNKGYFVPRYPIVPAHDPTDPFDCGFFFVLQKENFGKGESGSWQEFAENWSNQAQIADLGATKNVWETGYATAGLQDMLMFVGSSVFVKPLIGFRHYLAAQGGWWDRGADDQLPEGNGSVTTLRAADKSLAAVPFTPFLPPYAWPSTPFETGALNSADDWETTYGGWEGTTAPDLYDHTFSILTASRLNLWYVMEQYDPLRPHLMHFSNMHLAYMNRYSDIIHEAMEDFGSLFTTVQVDTIDVTHEASRFISDFAIGKDFGTPMRNTQGGGREPRQAPLDKNLQRKNLRKKNKTKKEYEAKTPAGAMVSGTLDAVEVSAQILGEWAKDRAEDLRTEGWFKAMVGAVADAIAQGAATPDDVRKVLGSRLQRWISQANQWRSRQ